MNLDLLEMIDQFAPQLFSVVPLLIRSAFLVAFFPGVSLFRLPMQLRIAFVLVLTLLGVWALPPMQDFDSLGGVLAQLPREILIGFFFGAVLRIAFVALQVTGSIAAQSLSLSQLFGGASEAANGTAFSRLLTVAGVALAAKMRLHLSIVDYLISGFEMLPPRAGMPMGIFRDIIPIVAQSFAKGFSIALPFVALSLIYNVTIGFVNRAMPQLMVSMVGAPASIAAAILLFFGLSPMMLENWFEFFIGVLAR